MSRSAALALVETLRLHGVDRVFCVPGESYIAVLDALVDVPEIEVVTCRHEGGAGFMAVADAKVTGRAGTCFVSRGPGATNAAIAVHTADQDATPLVLFVGQVERKDLGRRAFQEVDYRKTFSDMAKWVEQVHDADKLPEAAVRAYAIAESGTPGPVVVVLPEDMLEDATSVAAEPPRRQAPLRPATQDIASVAERLASAQRPVVIAGGGAGAPSARQALQQAAEVWALPVATSFKRQDLFPNSHPNFAGHLGYGIPAALGDALREADLVLAIGTRLGDITTQAYSLPTPEQTLVQVYPDADQFGRNFRTDAGIVADAEPFLSALAAHNPPPPPAGRDAWLARLHDVHARLAEWQPLEAADGVDFGHVVAAMSAQLADDAIVTMDAGNFSSWCHRHFNFEASHLLVGCVTGAMGLGVPGAVAAALRHPERQVVGLIGDGGMLMTGAELATAVQTGAKIRLIVANNGAFGTIRTHQEKKYPQRVISTDLANPDFAAMAEAYGAVGLRVERPEQAGPALEQALAADGPAVIDVHTSLEHISAYASISGLRGQ